MTLGTVSRDFEGDNVGTALDVFRTPTRTDTDSWINVVANISKLSQQIASTEFVPKSLRGNVPATAAAMLYGREIGLPPMTALTQIHVIEGRPGISAEGMRSLVYAAGHELVFDEATSALCRMRARRAHSEHWTVLEWTIDQARQAKLTGKDNWAKYSRAMLVARCTTDICRMVFPDVIHGFRSLEELEDFANSPGSPSSENAKSASRVRRQRSDASSPVAPSSQSIESVEQERPKPVPPLPSEDDSTASSESDGTASDATPAVSSDAAGAQQSDGDRVNKATQKIQMMQFRRLGIDARLDRLSVCSTIIGRELSSSWDETPDEASQINVVISQMRDAAMLYEALSTLGQPDEGEMLPLVPEDPGTALFVEDPDAETDDA